MRIILLAWFFAATAFSNINVTKGYTTEELEELRNERQEEVDSDAITRNVIEAFADQGIASAVYADEAMAAIVRQSVNVLNHYGHEIKAKKIEAEYERFYKNGFAQKFTGAKEIGDHPPMSEWVTKAHETIENALGLFLCKYFHLHDMYVLNYGIPTIFKPNMYVQKDYMDAFSGHLIWGYFWEHHGVTGIVTYWLVNTACTMGTSGLGIVAFICGPMSGWAETGMDKYIAPPVGRKLWTKAHSVVK